MLGVDLTHKIIIKYTDISLSIVAKIKKSKGEGLPFQGTVSA